MRCGAAPGRDPPILLPMRLQLVFFNVRCTVITDTRSKTLVASNPQRGQSPPVTFSAMTGRRGDGSSASVSWRERRGAGQGDQASRTSNAPLEPIDFPRRRAPERLRSQGELHERVDARHKAPPFQATQDRAGRDAQTASATRATGAAHPGPSGKRSWPCVDAQQQIAAARSRNRLPVVLVAARVDWP